MTKVFIQIPCYNEETVIGITLDALPRSLPGTDEIKRVIIDDGCTDRTVDVARKHGVDSVVHLNGHQGLARGFMAGIDTCLAAGADIIVNTDADNQYCADDIAHLIAPIQDGEADIVIGARPISDIEHFSFLKKSLQRLGSWVVRIASRTKVADAPSGFRAISRNAAMRLNVFGEYTYTLETLIQAGQNGFRVVSVPVRTNTDLRESRLIQSIRSYVFRSAATITRIFITYRPLRFFVAVAAALFGVGFVLGIRYLYFLSIDEGAGHVQSVILATSLMGVGSFVLLIGIIADLISINRKLLEQIDWRIRRIELARTTDLDAVGESKGLVIETVADQNTAAGPTRNDLMTEPETRRA
ncbi:MAG TPA: glycosyltransferase family 2 protein [Gammaproteobacteria bacterium]|nr:glycosyltransferase family 2 protein [Gammaproteobacteria bacterium]